MPRRQRSNVFLGLRPPGALLRARPNGKTTTAGAARFNQALLAAGHSRRLTSGVEAEPPITLLGWGVNE